MVVVALALVLAIAIALPAAATIPAADRVGLDLELVALASPATQPLLPSAELPVALLPPAHAPPVARLEAAPNHHLRVALAVAVARLSACPQAENRIRGRAAVGSAQHQRNQQFRPGIAPGVCDGPSMYQGFGNSPLNYGDPLGLCIGPWDELSCGEFASSFNPFSGGFWSRSWSFGSGYAVGAGKMAIAPGVLTYNLTGSVLYDLTGSHKYRAHKEVARQLGDKIYWALNNEADDVFVAAMDHLGAPMRNATDSAMRGDYFAAGMGGGETVATAILFYEAAASSPVPSAPAPATVPLASAGAVPAVVSTPSVTFVPGGVSGLTLMQGRNAPDELTRTRKTVVESPEATGAIRGLPPTIRRGFQKALEKLVLGERGFNQHRLRGDRAGQWAIDIPGTGKGRGAGRIFYRQTDDVVEILELDLKHKYLTPKD